MTYVFNDPSTFVDEMLAGFVDANANAVVRVPGGIVRSTAPREGKVAVVVGGGAGHYPAFCGIVGPGFADGAVVGNIFTSPSARDAESVAAAVDAGAGVLLTTGNYAGDVMNFTLALDRLRSRGIDARYFAVTDDVASAPSAEVANRRGIAGDFVVFKAAAAAAEEGASLAEVERIAGHANMRTRTLGVAFGGCRLPGQAEPLFTVEEGMMELGLGIHGEPGISTQSRVSASDLAALLVERLMDEAPADGGKRVAAILNGLGRTKYEELFVLWGAAAQELRIRGIEVVEPEVGELVTSLDMAGCSLTLTWLDDELQRLWHAPTQTPAYTKGVRVEDPLEPSQPARAIASIGGSPVAQAKVPIPETVLVVAALQAVADVLAAHEDELGRLDAVAGDGDHGRGMVRGSSAAVEAAQAAVIAGAAPGEALRSAGEAWADLAGGTSGVLWGAALGAAGDTLIDCDLSPAVVAPAIRAACEAIVDLGKAKPGDKTMLDALQPFADVLENTTDTHGLREAWTAALEAARAGAEATSQMRPAVGRARPLAERSLGVSDPGAVSLVLSLEAATPFLLGESND